MKQRRISRFLAFVLLVAMTLSLMPATMAFAEDAVTEEETQQGAIAPVEDAETPDPDPEEGSIAPAEDPAEPNGDADQTWQKVDLADITADDTIAITMTKGDTTWVLPAATTSIAPAAVVVTLSGDTLTTDDGNYAWTFTAVDGGYNITNSESKILYTTNANNGVRVGSPENTSGKVWSLDENFGYLCATPSEGGTRYLGVYNNQDWRAYKLNNNAIANNIKDQTLNFWKLNTEPVNPEAPATPTASVPSGEVAKDTVVTFDCATEGAVISYSVDGGETWTEGTTYTVTGAVTIKVKATLNGVDSAVATFTYTVAPELGTIAEALAGETGTRFKVKGVVTLVDGQNIYVQDATGGICLYLAAADTSIQLGDTLIGTGAKKVYKGLPELDQATVEKSEGLELTAKETTLAALTDADLCTYVSIKKLTVTAIDGDNTKVEDEAGNSLNIYKAKAEPALAVGDVIDFTGTLGTYNGHQLRNTKADEITLVSAAPRLPAAPTASVPAGAVDEGTEVTFTSATEGATVLLSVNDGETWDAPNPYTVNEAVTIKAKAVKDELESETVAFVYTIKTVEPTYDTIAAALAGENGTSFTVKGVVTLVDGKNIYVQDATGGICLYFSSAPTDIALGDTLIGTGTRAAYKGLPELSGATYTKSEGLELTAKETTLAALTDADLCTYVSIKKLTVTAIDGDNTKVEDEAGNSLNIYKAKAEPALAVGDVINFTGALGTFNGYQLRNTLTTEITPWTAPKVGFATSLDDLTDGVKVVIVNKANKIALSQNYGTNYNEGVSVTVTDGVLSGFGATEVWTVGVNEDGTYTFSTANGNKLSMDTQYSSMPLDKVNDAWTVTAVADTEDGFYIDNVGRSGYRMEWYADKNYWSSYYKNNTGDLFIQQFYLVGDEIPGPGPGGELNDGDQIVIYNANAESVIGLDDSGLNTSLSAVAATIADGKASTANGAYVFTVGADNGVYTFQSGGKYLATNDQENLFMTDALSDTGECCTYWTLDTKGDGYLINSKTARYNNSGVVCIEFFSGAFSGWTFKSSDSQLFIFNFYPLAEGMNTVDGVVNNPKVVFTSDNWVVKNGLYRGAFTIDDIRDAEIIDQVALTVNDTEVTELVREGKNVTFTLANDITGSADTLTCSVVVTYTNGEILRSEDFIITVKDEPLFSELTPAPNSQTLDEKCPLISVKVQNITEDTTFEMTVNKEPVEATMTDGVISYTPAEPLADGRTSVTVTVTRPDGVVGSKSWTFIVGQATMQLYFGQLHSHTAEYSDGAGTLADALNYVKGLPESANVQFVAFTDHSNYFDSSAAANPEGALYDMSLATAESQQKWAAYRQTVADFNEDQSDVVAIAGFEMTWSGGPGHINTFNSPGIVSRNNTTLNNKTNNAGMQAYYALLSQTEGLDTISQFNHPGKTFGNFIDFGYWNAVVDSRIFLVEVGNGEGQIGAGGYYPSYEQYTMALDKGWHVAPTNNQDNHKGKWGNANDARDVILTDDFSQEGIYNALRAMRVYATEDKNLEIYYTVNDLPLGSSITEVPEQLELAVSVNDPDSSDSIAKVEVVVNSGKVVHTWNDPSELASGALSVTLTPDYSYYFIRVTEGDGDLAVTAPVWVGETLKLGISEFTCGTSMPVTDEELTLTLSLFNSEAVDATVKSVIFTTDGSVVLGTDTKGYTLPASGILEIPFNYTPTEGRIMTITATVVLEQDGKEYTFSKDITLDVQRADKLVYLGIDASHYNEYVAGNYKDSMGNFSELAAGYGVRTVELKTSEALIEACSNEKFVGIILTAPSRRLAAAQSDPKTYSADELAALQAFNANGGTVIVAGWGDAYENYSAITGNPDIKHMAATQNELLEALGSSIRLGDDEVVDSSLNGGQEQRLYLSTYNFDSFLLEGVDFDPENPNNNLYTELYSNYGGCSVYFTGDGVPATVTPVVYGHATTNIANKDNDSNPQGVKYPYAEGDERVVVMATEQMEGKGLIIVSGAAFMSNFEVQAKVEDTAAEKNYSNYKICENLCGTMNQAEITPIAEVQQQTGIGYKYTIEGVVTSNASGYDKDTAFFDCIYVQDETAGICCFPVAGNYKIGDVVRITGYTDFYQAEMELQVMSITKIGETDPVEPMEVTAAQINDQSVLGSLVTLKGTVVDFEYENGLIQTILVKDAEGNIARVFIDGYITTGSEVENLVIGYQISATGLSSYDDTWKDTNYFPRIRVRNRADIVCNMADGFYLIGPDWSVGAIDPADKFAANPANPNELVLRTTLNAGDEIKVVEVKDGVIVGWYPDGMDNQYVVDEAHAGQVDVYFKTGYDSNWSAFGGFMWIEAARSAAVAGKSLSLKGNIEVNFYLDLPGGLFSDEESYVTINGEKILLTEGRISEVNGKTLYVFSSKVKFAHLQDEQLLRIYSGAGDLLTLLDADENDLTETGCVYRAQDYIEYIRANSEDEKLLAVVNALSDVGSLAQAQFNYNADSREDVVNDLSTVTADMVKDHELLLETAENAGVHYYGSSLLLRDATTIRHYFLINDDPEAYTFTVDGVEVTPVKRGSFYCIDITDIVARDLDRSFRVEVRREGNVEIGLAYSAMSYAYAQLSRNEESTLTDLTKAVVLYCSAANEYLPG